MKTLNKSIMLDVSLINDIDTLQMCQWYWFWYFCNDASLRWPSWI